jgi:hypothetical protein
MGIHELNDVLRDFVIWLAGFFAAAVAYLAVMHLAAARIRSFRAARRKGERGA